jgi:hypothetical protein
VSLARLAEREDEDEGGSTSGDTVEPSSDAPEE